MLADDRPAYPMNFFCRLRWSGRIDRPAFETALRATLARHPLLSAIVQRAGRRRLLWVAAENGLPLEWLTESSLHSPLPRTGNGQGAPADGAAFPHAPAIDLFRRPGLRISIVERSAASDVLLQFHHACCDGVGALRFAADLFASYAAATGADVRPALRTVAVGRLRHRNAFGLRWPALLRIVPRQLGGFLRLGRSFFRRCMPLLPHRPDPDAAAPAADHPTAMTYELDATETAGLHRAAEQLGVTVNELLVRDLFWTLAAWRTRRQPHQPRGWLRLSLPLSLRTISDRWLPAANVAGVVFVERRLSHCTNRRQLLLGIHRELQQAKRRCLGMTPVLLMMACRFLTGRMLGMNSAARCRATTVLTDMGSQLKTVDLPRRGERIAAGDMLLEGLDILGPLRPGTCASFATCQYAGRLFVTLHYDSRAVAISQAEDLLGAFMRSIRESIRTVS